MAARAAMAAARRASFVPLDAEPLLQPPERDDRPMCSPTATHTWRSIIAEWSVLEDEWMLTLIELGYRLGPELMVEMLVRHRNDAVRRTRVAIAAGPLAGWLSDHLPELQTKKAAAVKTVSAEAVATLPELAIPPELAELLVLDAHTFVQRLLPGFESTAPCSSTCWHVAGRRCSSMPRQHSSPFARGWLSRWPISAVSGTAC